MKKDEAKKALYREKPTARLIDESEGKFYTTKLGDGTEIDFNVPESEADENIFFDAMPAHLLIRWMENY